LIKKSDQAFMKALFPEKYHYYIYVFALILLVAGLPLSKFLMSLSQIILACNWLLEGNVINKFIAFWKNKTALIVSSLLLLLFIGLAYTSDFAYGLKDIRIKSPLFIIPLIISTSKPLSRQVFDTILKLLAIAVIIGTIISTLVLINVIHHPVIDIRDISIFISHIRFALLICVSIFISFYFIYNSKTVSGKIAWSAVIFWLVLFLILMESVTGLTALSIVTFVLLGYIVLKSKSRIIKFGALLFICGFITVGAYYINSVANENKQKDVVDLNKLDVYTSHGNLYEHDLKSKVTENGHLLWMYYSINELQQAWNDRSGVKINSKDLNGNTIYFTLFRFLTSKGLRKDADAVNSLTDKEVEAIERGVTNVNYQNISDFRF
jgi:hypothetical protein